MTEVDNKIDNKIDYLEVDDMIPGQNYACLSFVSPESFIQNKEAFNTAKFLQSYCSENKLKYEDVYEKYKDFTYKHEKSLQRDYDEKNDFRTSIRGIKVRGVYSERREAEAQAKKLSIRDGSHHVFIGQVGYWLPWDPNADNVDTEVYQDEQLNDLMENIERIMKIVIYFMKDRSGKRLLRREKEFYARKKRLKGQKSPNPNPNPNLNPTRSSPKACASRRAATTGASGDLT